MNKLSKLNHSTLWLAESIHKIMEPFNKNQKLIQDAMKPTIELQKTIAEISKTIFPDFSWVTSAIESINKNYSAIIWFWEELRNLNEVNSSIFLETKIQKIDNAIEFKGSYVPCITDLDNDIINLWEEIYIDVERSCFINPINKKEMNFKSFPKVQRIMIEALIKNLIPWCELNDFWTEFETLLRIDNKERKLKNKNKRGSEIFISNRIKNLKDMVYRNLWVKNRINFIKSQNKVYKLIICLTKG